MFTESNFIVKFWPTSGVVGGVKQTICLWEAHLIFMKILYVIITCIGVITCVQSPLVQHLSMLDSVL